MSPVSKIRETLIQIWQNTEIRNKLWFTLIVIIIFRVMAAVPVPGIPLNALDELFGDTNWGEMISMMSGGVLEQTTLVAIGLAPYINASVIFQLLGSIIPKIGELQKEGERGRKLLNMYTRLLTIPLAILQSLVIYSTLKQFEIIDPLGALDLVTLIATLTAGAAIMMWLGELVSEQGVGGGSTLIILAGILAGIPGSLKANIDSMDFVQVAIMIVMLIVVTLIIVIISQAERKVPIQYARRVRSVGTAAESHIPLKLNQSGVMPVIFAISMLSFPQMVGQFLTGENIPETIRSVSTWITTQLENVYTYNGILFVLIVLFSLFYLFVVFNPANVAENLQKQAAFIPGVRPGKQTEQYLARAALRLGVLGALFLGIIALLPAIASETGILVNAIMSGTGLLIVVGGVLDMKRQVESMIVTRNYETYL